LPSTRIAHNYFLVYTTAGNPKLNFSPSLLVLPSYFLTAFRIILPKKKRKRKRKEI
jgi:hypothetical protein